MKNFFKKTAVKQVEMEEFLEMDYQEILSLRPHQTEMVFSEMQFQIIEARQELENLRGE